MRRPPGSTHADTLFPSTALFRSVRTGTDASIVAIAPIRQIMPALLPRPRMVRYLVARQAGGARHRLRRVEQVGGGVAVGDDELALRRQRREARARLDGELIERQMAGAEGQRRAKDRKSKRLNSRP